MGPVVVNKLKMSNKINRGSSECHAWGGGGCVSHINVRMSCAFGCRSTLARVLQHLRGFPEDAQMPVFLSERMGELTEYRKLDVI